MSQTADDVKYYLAVFEMQNRYKAYRSQNNISKIVGSDGKL